MNIQDIILLTQQLGFPIVITLILMFAIYKIGVWGAGIIKESQKMLREAITHQKESTNKMVQTQDKIAETQREIVNTLQNIKL
jgi:hypothetical protein